jgi:hypothetical protein
MARDRHIWMGCRLQTAHIPFGTANSHIKTHHPGAKEHTLVLLQTSLLTPPVRPWQCFTLAPFTPLRLSISFITISLTSPYSPASGIRIYCSRVLRLYLFIPCLLLLLICGI